MPNKNDDIPARKKIRTLHKVERELACGGSPLVGKVGLEPTVYQSHGFTVRCTRRYAYLPILVYVVFRIFSVRGGYSRSIRSET